MGGNLMKIAMIVLVNQFHGNFHSKTLRYWTIMSVFRDVKWCFNASWGLKGLTIFTTWCNLLFSSYMIAYCYADRMSCFIYLLNSSTLDFFARIHGHCLNYKIRRVAVHRNLQTNSGTKMFSTFLWSVYFRTHDGLISWPQHFLDYWNM